MVSHLTTTFCGKHLEDDFQESQGPSVSSTVGHRTLCDILCPFPWLVAMEGLVCCVSTLDAVS